jgi:hypothetical protein
MHGNQVLTEDDDILISDNIPMLMYKSSAVT